MTEVASASLLEVLALVSRLRKRTHGISEDELRLTQQKLTPHKFGKLIGDWLQGCWHLYRYQHARAYAVLLRVYEETIRTRNEIARAPMDHMADEAGRVNSDLAVISELDFEVRESFIEACVMLNNFERALHEADELLLASRSNGNRMHLARALSWLGAAQVQTGNYQEAITSLTRAVDEYEHLGCAEKSSRALNGLGIVHEENGDFGRACHFYAAAHDAAVKDADFDMQGRALANWGDALVNVGNFDDALVRLGLAIEVLESIGAYWHSGWCELAIGKALAARGEMAGALEMHQRALVSVRKCESPRIEAEVLAGLGELHGRMGHYELARMQLEEGLALATRTGIDREIFKTHKMLADLHKQFGNFERALNHHEQFHQVRAKVFDEMGRLKLARLTDQLELERIQRERETSQLRNVELARVLSEVQRLNEELTEKAKAFEYLSNQDTLTGLYNRRFLYARMNEEIGRVDRHGSRLAVVLYDVDHFKQVNDQHSHTLGDDVLRTIAKVVTQALRHTDVHVRYGGEEFAVMMPETSLEQAQVVAEKLRELVSSFEWQQIAPKLSLSISAGVVALRDGESMADILRRVDAKLYEAKRGGRNRVMVG